jgi:hypothetical protein
MGNRPPVALVVALGKSGFPGRTVLLSIPTGETLLEFTPGGFYGTSLGHNGQWIIGHVEGSADGHRIDSGEIWVASRTGRWIRSLTGVQIGVGAKSPARGDWLAFNDPTTLTVHIGHLRVTP